MSFIDGLIKRFAKHDFSKTAVVAEMTVFILSFIGVAAFIAIALISLDISVPAKIQDPNTLITNQKYYQKIIDHKRDLNVVINRKKYPITITSMQVTPAGKLSLATAQLITGEAEQSVRIVLEQRRIISLLFHGVRNLELKQDSKAKQTLLEKHNLKSQQELIDNAQSENSQQKLNPNSQPENLDSVVTDDGITDYLPRIISLSPSITEILCEIGVGDRLVAVSTACDFPLSAASLPKIGHFLSPSIEMIVRLDPEFVIGMGDPKNPAVRKLSSMNINSLIYRSPDSIADLYLLISDIGKKLDLEQNADSLIQKLKQGVLSSNLLSNTNHEKKQVLLVISYPPIRAVGGHSFINEMIDYAGGENVLRDTSSRFPVLNPEHVVMLHPDIILLCGDYSNTDVSELSRLCRSDVRLCSNPDVIVRPGSRILDGICLIKDIITDKL
ncbi:helical backbone metal receptor [Thermoproteota archaeon]